MAPYNAGYRRVTVRSGQRGMILVMSLLLLVVITLLAVAMFRGLGLDSKIAGNVREKQRALHAAASAEQYAEYWLSQGANSSNVPTPCTTSNTGVTPNAAGSNVVICSNIPYGPGNTIQAGSSAPGAAPFNPAAWPTSSTANVGFYYSPPGMTVATPASGGSASYANAYAGTPAFYISYLGPWPDASNPGNVFQIDAYGYGGTKQSVAVIESTFLVTTGVKNLGGP